MPVTPVQKSETETSRKATQRVRRRNFKSLEARKTTTGRRGTAIQGARNRLRQFKQATLLAVAFTGFLILLLNPGETGYAQDALTDTVASREVSDSDTTTIGAGKEIKEATKTEAFIALQNLEEGFLRSLPKILVALVTIFLAWGLAKLLRYILKKTISGWKTAGAISALTSISVWLLAVGVAVSVLAGDIRALIGSLGLVGLALSWSLQTPIESFTGWLLNSFKRYYKIGDRIQVGDVFGDVYKIDFLTTTVWEIGAPYRQGFVMAEQPTGRLVTFPNNEILTGSIVNLTSDFPYVWDELTVAVANESDIRYTVEVVKNAAIDLLKEHMEVPVRDYERILTKAGLSTGTDETPHVYVSANESWTDIIVRYLVGAKERRKWKSKLTLRMIEEFNRKEHQVKIKPAYHRRQVQIISDGQMETETDTTKK